MRERVPPVPQSSSPQATGSPRLSPSYADKTLSNPEPHVSTVTGPLPGAVHRYHTEFVASGIAPGGPWPGSPHSAVAPELEPVAVSENPDRTSASDRWSFAGPPEMDQFSVRSPVAPPLPSTAM